MTGYLSERPFSIFGEKVIELMWNVMYSGSQKKTSEGSEVRIGNEVRKESKGKCLVGRMTKMTLCILQNSDYFLEL